MKQSGRVSFLTIAGLAGVIVVIALLFFGRQSPSQSASQFMNALAKGDANELTRLTYLDGESPEEVKRQWTYATEVASKYYRFHWKLGTEMLNSEEVASVKVQLIRNLDSPSSYEENFALPMIRKDNKWLVDVRAMSRAMYPGLPR